ncbi:MAG: hypothetical protein LBI35_06515 [Burkholderiales bacterium]|jgi:hypothetical protein|nr:hypothetical protein [Burkholderiales bacterium]
MIRNLILAAIAALVVGAAGGGWLGYRQASNACDSAFWKSYSETLKKDIAARKTTALFDRVIAAATSEKTAATEAEYAKLRRDYDALKKSLPPKKKDAPEWAQCAAIKASATILPDTFEGSHHASILPTADDLPLSDDLFSLYISTYTPLLRADP